MPNGHQNVAPDPAAPDGRRLADFGALSPAEQTLVAECRRGQPAIFRPDRPDVPTPDNRLRGALVRFLALGGDGAAPVHENGVDVRGAWIDDGIDLRACTVSVPLRLAACRIVGLVDLGGSELREIKLDGSSVWGVDGDYLKCRGSIHLSKGFVATRTCSFDGASIGGNLNCRGGQLLQAQQPALSGKGAEIKGDVYLGGGVAGEEVNVAGEVTFTGARIGGSVDFTGSTFAKNIWFVGAEVSADFFLVRANFPGAGLARRSELILSRMDVSGRFCVRGLTGSVAEILLRGAHAFAVVDDAASWDIAGRVLIDGFTYDRFLETGLPAGDDWILHVAPTDAAMRIRWIEHNAQRERVENFRPQPWEQLGKVLRDGGYQEAAREVAIARQRWQGRARAAQQRAQFQPRVHPPAPAAVPNGFVQIFYCLQYLLGALIPRVFQGMLGVFAGYGYRPLRIFYGTILVWFACALFFRVAANNGVMAPTDGRFYTDATSRFAECQPAASGNWTQCNALPNEYTRFSPWLYSLDLILPLVGLQQKKDWAPMKTRPCRVGRTTRRALAPRLPRLGGDVGRDPARVDREPAAGGDRLGPGEKGLTRGSSPD